MQQLSRAPAASLPHQARSSDRERETRPITRYFPEALHRTSVSRASGNKHADHIKRRRFSRNDKNEISSLNRTIFPLAHGNDLERERHFQLYIPLVSSNICFIFCDIKCVFKDAAAYLQKKNCKKNKTQFSRLGFFTLRGRLCVCFCPRAAMTKQSLKKEIIAAESNFWVKALLLETTVLARE